MSFGIKRNQYGDIVRAVRRCNEEKRFASTITNVKRHRLPHMPYILIKKSPADLCPTTIRKLYDSRFLLAQISSVRNLNVVSITKLYIVDRDCLFGKSVQAGCSSGSHSLPSPG